MIGLNIKYIGAENVTSTQIKKVLNHGGCLANSPWPKDYAKPFG
jgi:hypothetical protein